MQIITPLALARTSVKLLGIPADQTLPINHLQDLYVNANN